MSHIIDFLTGGVFGAMIMAVWLLTNTPDDLSCDCEANALIGGSEGAAVHDHGDAA